MYSLGSRRSGPRCMTIRSHLLLLAIAAVLPVLAFAVVLSDMLVDQDRLTVRRGAMERARAMMTAVDAELRGSLRTVEALTASPALQRDDYAAFRAEAVRVLATQPTWLDVTLARASGEKVIDALRPAGALLGRVVDPPSFGRAVETRRPAIGGVGRADTGTAPAVPVRVPVLRDGAVAYVVTALVRPDSFEDLIRQQRLPARWISGIVDAAGRFVARIPSRPPGEPASDAYREAVRAAPEGWYRGLTVEGRDTYTAHERSEFGGWSIGLAIPADIVQAAAQQTMWLMGVGVLASIVVALAIAGAIGRRIGAPIVALASVARSIGTGERSMVAVRGNVQEAREVAVALREADAAVRERQQLIQREKDALEAADRTKDEFIATLSHELRNPLAALTAAAHVLRIADPTQAAARDACGVIERQTRHMSRMIEDLLDVSRLIAGKVKLVPEAFDLGQLVAHSVDTWRASGRCADRSLVVHAEGAWVRADRTRVEQIVSNLLDNAVKFTSPGGSIAVDVRREADAEAVTVSVADDGEGIPQELAGRVFDVFVQGEQGVGRARGGMGLGLTIVKRLAELQGGSVRVASAGPGRGATFAVRLPAAAMPEPATSAAASAARRPAPLRILLVEDNADARAMLREVLSMEGHEIDEAADGQRGVELAIATHPDLAIVDIGLPDIDGYEVARLVRAQARERIALIALTGYGQPEDAQRAAAAGFDLHLVKPVGVERLQQAVAALAPRERGRTAGG